MDTIVSPPQVVVEPEKAPTLLQKAMRPLRIILIVLITFILLCVAIAAIFERQIGEKLISVLNESIATEIKVESFDLSLLRNFPKVSAQLEEVDLIDLNSTSLLRARTVSFNLGLFSLFGGSTKIPEVQVSDGTVFIQLDKKGEGNFNIFKNEGDSAVKDFSIDIEKAIFENVAVIYTDLRGPHEVKIKINDGNISGRLTGKAFDLNVISDLSSEYIDLDDHKYLVNTPASMNAQMHIDLKERKYTFTKAQLNIDNNPLQLGGSVQSTNESTIFDLQVLAKDGDIATLISFLPEQYTKTIADFKSSGDFTMVGKIKGPLSDTKNPAIDLLFGLSEGQIKSRKFNQTIKGVSFKGKFTNGLKNNNKTSHLQIKDFKGSFRGEPLKFNLAVRNLDRPSLNLTLDGKIATVDVVKMIDNPSITGGEGTIRVKSLGINGLIKDLMDPAKMTSTKAKGRAELEGISFKYKKEDIDISNGRFLLTGNKMSLSTIKIEAIDSDISLSGNCYNLIPVLMADSIHQDDIQLRFSGHLVSEKLDLDALANLFATDSNNTSVDQASLSEDGKSKTKNQFITGFLQGTFSAKVNNFHYDKIEGSNFSGQLEIDDNELMIEGQANGMGGDWILDGTVFLEEKINADARLACEGIDIKEFFRQANNFGQDVLRTEHIKGTLLANLKIDAFWDENGTFNMDDLHVLGDVAIADGALDNFEMLYSFSKYINADDLRHVRFTTMRNWLEVKNRKISIPNMFIQSNALNMELCGLHTFENKIDYNFKINAGQVLVNKFRKQDAEFIKEQRDGLINLHYRVWGSIKDYRVKSDAKYVKRKLRETKAKKYRIQNTLKREFGNLNIPDDNWRDNPRSLNREIPTEIISQEESPEPYELKQPIEKSTPEIITTEGLGPSADGNTEPDTEKAFRLEELLNKKKPVKKPSVPSWELPSGTGAEEEDDEEFLNFTIEGEGKKKGKKKAGGN